MVARWGGRFGLAVGCLGGSWLVACEALRERAPVALGAFVVLGWSPAFAAWRAALPARRAAAVGLTTALLALDVAVDLWLPYERRFALVGWEALRLAAVLAALAALRVPRVQRWLAPPAWTGRALRAGSALPALLVGAAAVYIATTGTRDATAPADAALVLGFSLDEHHRPAQPLRDRVAHAVALYHRGLVPVLVLSGGDGPDGRGPTEAEAMADLARAAGVPDAALRLETRARSTVENIRNAVPVLRSLGARRVLLVTEPYHMPRALLLARRAGLDGARPSPAPSHAWRSPRAVGYWVFRDAIVYVAERAREPFIAARDRGDGARP